MSSENNKEIKKALEGIKGAVGKDNEQIKQMEKLAEKYSDKSQDEIFFEIMQLNQKLSNDMGADEFKNKLNQLDKIRPMLNEEQNKKLDKLLKVLKGSL